MTYCRQYMKKFYLILFINFLIMNTANAKMKFLGFVASDDRLHGIGRYCVDNSVFITNLILDKDTAKNYVPVGSPVQVYVRDQGKIIPKYCN